MSSDATSGLADLRDALRRHAWSALLVSTLLFAGVVAYVERLPDAYDGSAVVAFSPRAEQDVGADVIRIVLPKYVAYLSSQATARTVAGELGEQERELMSSTDVSVAPETANLEITVRLPTPKRAADVANALAYRAVELSTVDSLLVGRVVAPALPAAAPASPPRRLLEAGGLLLALLVGLTYAVVADRSRPKVTDPLSAALVSGYGVVGRVPRSRAVREDPLAALLDPVIGTAVRALRTQITQAAGEQPVAVLAVTSSTPGEGKTTVAAALAGAFANVDARVLLIDGDMRRPRVVQALDLSPDEPGLAELLEGTASFDDVLQSTDKPGLSVLPTRAREDAGDLLTRRMRGVLDEARGRYDVVVIDCPPVLATDDARTLCLLADATLLVVGSGTEVGRLSEAAGSLDSLRVRVLGAVLNRTRTRRRDGLGSYGRYGTA